MMEIAQLHSLFLSCSGVSTDTRSITNNSMFFALKGERFDANTFTEKALENGATYVVIDNEDFLIDSRTILVDDSLKTLQELATFHRKHLKLSIIALTGSNGKTTTKELIQVVLSKKYNTKATLGNLNNHIGVPLTLLSFTKETEIGIVEMGANHQNEIAFLCELALPDFGYITNFGKAHLEGFGGLEGVIKGKSEMYSYLLSENKHVFVNVDDVIQKEKTNTFNRITFSQKESDAFVFIKSIEANPMVIVRYDKIEVKSNLIGLYNANNINAAITIGKYFNVPDASIKEAIENYFPENNRSQLLFKGSNEIILDAYNANPSSMEVAISNFIQLQKTNKIVILGDMFELGSESLREHLHIVSLVEHQTSIKSFLVGKDFYANRKDNEHMWFFPDFESFSSFFRNHNLGDCCILIKGSRGMALERTLELL